MDDRSITFVERPPSDFPGDWAPGYTPRKPPRVVPEKQPFEWARAFAEDVFPHKDRPAIARYKSQWWRWEGRCWRVISNEAVESAAWQWCATTSVVNEKTGIADLMRPAQKDVRELVAATSARHFISDDAEMPSLLGPLDIDPDKALACANGILDLRNRRIDRPSPLLFTCAATAIEFLPRADSPIRWLRFLRDVWGNDEESKSLLQEFVGLCMTSDLSFQKILLLVGPRRSGKSTINRIIEALVGTESFHGGSFSSLESNFGMQPLIGKLVASFPDVRVGDRSNSAMIVERLLNISGEDRQPIDRKGISVWSGRLRCRIVLGSNEFPNLRDQSGALNGRLLILKMTRSFYGEEDRDLARDLLAEAPGIMNWALDGLERLYQRGYFVQPRSSADFMDEMGRLSSPMKAFVDDMVEQDPHAFVPCDQVYARWKMWCVDMGLKPTADSVFGRDLRSVIPGIRNDKKMVLGTRSRHYLGLRLKHDRDHTKLPTMCP